ncbi:MAG: hypothetical protein K6T65_08805 [Peptococcaceae bacterium]|nr:hypothetical protein [Peptococcaceae bacterium]
MKIKKRIILKLLKQHPEGVPLDLAARHLYNKTDELAQLKVIRALNAYRAKDSRFFNIRVRNKNIVFLGGMNSEAGVNHQKSAAARLCD